MVLVNARGTSQCFCGYRLRESLGIIFTCWYLISVNLQMTFPSTFLVNAFSQRSSATHHVSKRFIVEQASKVRSLTHKPSSSLFLPPPSSALYYPSSYTKKVKVGKRGFCNWLIPNYVMIGQYPGMTPESSSATFDEAQDHIDAIMTRDMDRTSTCARAGKIKMFCCLQDEIPSQNDDSAWSQNGGRIQLPIGEGREDFPGFFNHYAPMVEGTRSSDSNCDIDDVEFLHAPIVDLSTPDSSSLRNLLSTILSSLIFNNNEDDDVSSSGAVYIHCWGGRGRAGLVGACLLSLIYPELSAEDCLDWVQKGYDTRDGAAFMPVGLRRSPQTAKQREFVCKFVKDFRGCNNR